MKRLIAIAILGGLAGCFVFAPQSKALAQPVGHSGPVRALAVFPDGNNAISGSADGSAIYWSLTSNVAEQTLRFHGGAVNAVAVGPNDRIITAGDDGRLALWAPGGQVPVRVLQGHTGPILSLAISPDSKFVASASADRTIRIWPLAGGNPYVFQGHKKSINGVAFLDAKTFVTVSEDLTLQIWPIFGGGPLISTLPTQPTALAVAANALIIVGGDSGHVFCFSRDGERVARLTAGDSPVTSLSTSPDGKFVAATTRRASVAIMEPETRKLARTLSGPGLPALSTAFFPDNRMLLTGGTDHKIRRWDGIGGKYIGLVGPE
jgi:cytochrome c